MEKFKDEYQPFGIGLDNLDFISVADLLRREGASEACIRKLAPAILRCTSSGKPRFCACAEIPPNRMSCFVLRAGTKCYLTSLRVGSETAFERTLR